MELQPYFEGDTPPFVYFPLFCRLQLLGGCTPQTPCSLKFYTLVSSTTAFIIMYLYMCKQLRYALVLCQFANSYGNWQKFTKL